MSAQPHTIETIQSALQQGETTAVALTEAALARIEADSTIHAFISVDRAGALAQAAIIDQKIADGAPLGTLAGVTFGIKDNICTTELPTTCASLMLDGYQSTFDATIIEKLKAADAIIIGKTNLDEFAMGATTESSYYGTTRNPRNPEHVPGGSSGGSAAAVAGDFCACAIGSDTGGSIRQPAAFCGVFGLKPTYGTVSRYGLFAFASSLDQIGPIANSVKDLGLILNTIAGYDAKDATSADITYEDYTVRLGQPLTGLRIGVPEEYLGDEIAAAVCDQVTAALDVYRNLGAEVSYCSLPNTRYAIPAYYLISPAEASSNMARYDGVRFGYHVEADDMIGMFKATRSEGLGEEVKRRIMLGTYALSAGYFDAFYLKALRVRQLIKQDFENVFESYDCLLTPTTVNTAPLLGQQLDAAEVYKQDMCTATVNLAGLPALSMPFGEDSQHLPIGLQLIGRAFEESVLLQVADAFQVAVQEGGAE